MTIFSTHTEIHRKAKRALPDQMINYKLSITMHKMFQTCQPEQEFINLNFQLNQNPRISMVNFFKRQNYCSGKNILLNNLAHLNNIIKHFMVKPLTKLIQSKMQNVILTKLNNQFQVKNNYWVPNKPPTITVRQ